MHLNNLYIVLKYACIHSYLYVDSFLSRHIQLWITWIRNFSFNISIKNSDIYCLASYHALFHS